MSSIAMTSIGWIIRQRSSQGHPNDPFDTTTLLLLAGRLKSLIAGEAAPYGDTLTLHIDVAPKIMQISFDAPRPGRPSWPSQCGSFGARQSFLPRHCVCEFASNGHEPPGEAAQVGDRGWRMDQFGYDRLVVNAAVLTDFACC
jgi:hypothetical protein